MFHRFLNTLLHMSLPLIHSKNKLFGFSLNLWRAELELTQNRCNTIPTEKHIAQSLKWPPDNMIMKMNLKMIQPGIKPG